MQVVPQGIESVNGSNVNMGCASPLVDRDGVMVCDNTESYLVDGCPLAIDTNTSNWASQLVTVRRNAANDIIDVDHVVLTFTFSTAVLPTSIELDMFLCPEWNDGAAFIFVYADQNSSLVLDTPLRNFFGSYQVLDSVCDSLSTVRMSFENRVTNTFYHSWHILVDFTGLDNEWFHVGDVRFLNVFTGNHTSCSYIHGATEPIIQ